MAAGVTRLGPPIDGPGSSAETLGFALSATTRPGAYSNRELVSGNLLCHKKNVERNYAIHESRLASVKASLSLGRPLRPNFVKKRLSKKFHLRKHHERVVCENLKLLQRLRDIHSRGDQEYYRSSESTSWSQEKFVSDSVSSVSATANAEERGKGVASFSSSKLNSHKLNMLVTRRRNAEAAMVGRENQKMQERMTQYKSLYSKENLRKHRNTRLRVLRLRKTDYTVGHLLAATTAMHRWAGGDSRDDGFSYSFEEDRGRPRRRGKQRKHRDGRGTSGGSSSLSMSRKGDARSVDRTKMGHSYSPSPTQKFGPWKGGGGARGGAKSAPRLPSLVEDSSDIYGGSNPLGSPDLEQCQLAKEKLLKNAGRRGSGGVGEGGDGSRDSSLTSIVNFAPQEDGDRKRRPGSDGTLSGGGSGSRVRRRGKSLQRESSLQRVGDSDGCSVGGVGGSESVVATRGTNSSSAMSSYTSSWESSDTNPRTGSRIHRSRQFMKRREEECVGKRGKRSAKSSTEEDLNDVGEDRIPNPLALPGKNDGIRVLVQATRTLEDFNRAGGKPWVCFIRIVAKDPFDDQLDVRAILDREEMCRRVLSLEEANKIWEGAEEAAMLCDQSVEPGKSPIRSAIITTPSPERDGASATLQSSPASTLLPPGGAAGGSASFEKSAVRRISPGVKRRSMMEESLGEVLTRMFVEADTEGKGYLAPEQLRSMMHHANLGLSGPELQLVIAEADENADGNIDYYEFVPMVYNLVHTFRARRKAFAEMQDESLYLDQKAIRELYDAEFDRTIQQLKGLCKSRDAHGTGVLPLADLKWCISSANRSGGLTRIESKLLLSLLPRDPQDNVIYRRLGAALEQVRFATLRKRVAEEGTTDTERYLLGLCREEDLKNTGDAITGVGGSGGGGGGGKHYSGVLRARQLTKLLLDAPMLSLNRPHVTALVNQVHTVDGMVNYVELVPMMTKTIEGIFRPQCLKIRQEIFKGVGGSAGGASVKGVAGLTEGGEDGAPAEVVGRTRDEVQNIFMDVLRDENVGNNVFERLKDLETFAKCMAALGLNAEPDAIKALWEATDLGSREDATFVDIVDFCFTCALLLDREKQVKGLHQTSASPSATLRSGSSGQENSAVTVAAVTAVMAAASSGTDVEKPDPLLRLARVLVRQAKVTYRTEGKVDLEFPHGEQTFHGSRGKDNTAVGDDKIAGAIGQLSRDTSSAGWEMRSQDGGASCYSDGSIMSLNDGAQYNDADVDRNTPIAGSKLGNPRNRGRDGEKETETGAFEGQLRSEAKDATSLFKTRRRGVPFIDTSGQPITRLRHRELEPIGSSSSVEPETSQENDEDMVIHVYWEGEKRNRAFVEAYPVEDVSVGRKGGPRKCLRLGVRVPTLAIVDAKAATKFAERVAEQVAIEVDTDSESVERKHGRMLKKKKKHGQQKEEMRLRLVGVDAKAVCLAK